MSNQALGALDRALKGDAGALSFLERTASIYVLDATNPSHPKTYGCWDFLNQALNEVERHESSAAYQQPTGMGMGMPPQQQVVDLAPHVQLLTSLSRRAARRPPPSDRSLIRTCLTNAATSGAFRGASSYDAVARDLVNLNCQTRERVMGRIAALAFDFSLHAPPRPGQHGRSAFADPRAMEGLCTIVAANSVSSGPGAFRHLVEDWIVPSAAAGNLPPFSVAAVCAHLANEAAGRAAPAGTGDALEAMFDRVVSGVLAPALADAVRESDVGEGEVDAAAAIGVGQRRPPTRNQRLAAMTLRAMERWCAATRAGMLRVARVCARGENQVNIVEVLSDTLYSDAEIVIDAAAELFDTLLRKGSDDAAALEGMSIVSSVLGSGGPSGGGLGATESAMREEEREREAILAELVSAIGLQRFRFSAAQSEGAAAVCRCLARIAASLAVAAQHAIGSGRLQDSADGLVELLLKAAAHHSVHVCAIALEALPRLVSSYRWRGGTGGGHDHANLSSRLLPVLQQRAIVPASLRGAAMPAAQQPQPQQVDCGVDFHEYASFRENLLSAALRACYLGGRTFFLESCAAAVDEFCAAAAPAPSPSPAAPRPPPPAVPPQVPYQLEAALFCLGAVSDDASRRAVLAAEGTSPAAVAAAARATAREGSRAMGGGGGGAAAAPVVTAEAVAEEARRHDEELARCVAALSRNPSIATSNPLTLSQMCRFLGAYANWLSKTPTPGSLDNAAKLALESFNLASSGFANDSAATEMVSEMSVSPIAEAATALRNILTRSPGRFATPQALSALGTGWEASYTFANASDQTIKIEDREALCSGLCRVLASLPPERWTTSLTSLSQPTVNCLELIAKQADDVASSSSSSGGVGGPKTSTSPALNQVLVRIAHEIRLLVVMTSTFQNAATKEGRKQSATSADHMPPTGATGGGQDGPNATLIAVLRRPWPCLSHIAQRYSSFEPIASALGELLVSAVRIQDDSGESSSTPAFFRGLCDMAADAMTAAAARKDGAGGGSSSHGPMLFVREAVDVYGHLAEASACAAATADSGAAAAASASDGGEGDPNAAMRSILERLLVLSFEAARAAAGDLWSRRTTTMEQGNGERPAESSAERPTPTPERPPSTAAAAQRQQLATKSPDEISAMFSILDMCVVRCPVLLVRLSAAGPGAEQDDPSLFVASVDAAAMGLREKEASVARSAMLFLKSMIEMRASSDTSSSRSQLTAAAVDGAILRVRRVVILTLMTGICGIFPRDVIDPAASLLAAVLKNSPPEEAEVSSVEALNQEQFRMGNEAKETSLHVLANCARGSCPLSTLVEFADDLWQLHQCDDTGAVAGGDEVIRFAKKYRVQR